ncbi:hypothetical protein D6C91_00616 [Aureobasidium pullulans]|uniref:Protein kinase domain-containing protein n=1 Tax=Aureobasidium pullulans TaxID=5580 RepID=A0A4S9U1Z1_AURPU|nr:hypothetical protein D6C91_00616 [Aureobasidium pullulans]
MAAYRRQFDTLRYNFLDQGNSGIAYTISQHIILKCPTLREEKSHVEKHVNNANTASIDHEKDIYTAMASYGRHPNAASYLLARSPWAKEDAQGNCPQAGPETEQFSLGSCIFNIRYGHPPYAELESPVWYEYMSHQRYPPTPKGDDIGDIIQACWRGDYASIE